MPRGKEILIPLPRKGITCKIPYNDVPPDSIFYAENMFFDVSDGSFKTRKGTYPITKLPSISGSYLYDDEFYLVANTDKKIYSYNLNQNSSVGITPSEITSFGKAKYFLYFQTNLYIVMCDGKNKLIRWKKGDTTATVIENSPVFVDAIVQTSRIIGIDDTKIRLRWSSVYDMNTYPETAYIAIPEAEELIAICPLKHNVSALYSKQGIYLVYSQPGTDASAFRVEKVTDKIPDIMNRFCVVSVQGVNFYLGRDRKLYMFDGGRVVEITFLRSLLDVSVLHGSPFIKYNPTSDWIYIVWSVPFENKSKAVVYDFRNNICAGYLIYPYVINDWIFTFAITKLVWKDANMLWSDANFTWEDTAFRNNFLLTSNKIYTETGLKKDDVYDIIVELILPPLVSSGDVMVENIELFVKNNNPVSVYLGRVDNLVENVAFSYLKDVDLATNPILNLLTDRYARTVFIKCKTKGNFEYYGGRAFVYERPVMQREMA